MKPALGPLSSRLAQTPTVVASMLLPLPPQLVSSLLRQKLTTGHLKPSARSWEQTAWFTEAAELSQDLAEPQGLSKHGSLLGTQWGWWDWS